MPAYDKAFESATKVDTEAINPGEPELNADILVSNTQLIQLPS